MRMFTMFMNDIDHQKLKARGFSESVSMSQIMRDALKQYLSGGRRDMNTPHERERSVGEERRVSAS
jgi:hypothetical protein